jgi:acyl-[acyl-carrier-protein]-phospholipid O-acyltransferase/long-chain-fatty-acid--[acyl-carrier-protein] ligase
MGSSVRRPDGMAVHRCGDTAAWHSVAGRLGVEACGTAECRHPFARKDAMLTADDWPPLMRDRSFWALNATQFLGAFNDNLFKQLVLLVSVKLALVDRADNLQGVAMFVFSLPFVLLSGVFGMLADRQRKRTIIVLCKMIEVAAMLLGMLAFLSGSLTALMAVLFLMGAHSAYFGPAKYGILPELFLPHELPRANGWMLMMTFLSIILGVAAAGQLMEWCADRLWLASLACMFVAALGLLTALPIRNTPVAQPGAPMQWSRWFMSRETWHELRHNRPLLSVLIVTSVFWCVGGVYQQGVNDLGILQLQIKEGATGLLSACAALGIAAGCVVAGRLSRGTFNARLVRGGLWGMALLLTLLALPGPFRGHTLLGVTGSGVALIALGASAGLFAVPLQVYLQSQAPVAQKGQIIGTMNLFNWVGILLSAVLHWSTNKVLARTNAPPNLVFLVAAALLLPLLVLYRPRSQQLTM